MKKISFVVGRDYLNNRLFDLTNPKLNRDDCLRAFYLLKVAFEKKGYELSTQDLISPKDADIVIYNEMPKPFPRKIYREKSYLLIFETELIRKDNWDKKKHRKFKKIFTWRDNIVDNKRYFKFNFPNTFKSFEINNQLRPHFMTLISGNKISMHPLELYSERLNAIKWFENNHPDEFDYYGVGWDYRFDMQWQKLLRKLHVLKYMPKNESICYKGLVADKHSTLLNYQFAICFENGCEIPGYITEKIMDCFFAGCIPIYWGAKNISDHIPANTFIDMRKFESIKVLYEHLKQLTLEDIQKMQKAILDFLNSDQSKPFTNEQFVETIVEKVINAN